MKPIGHICPKHKTPYKRTGITHFCSACKSEAGKRGMRIRYMLKRSLTDKDKLAIAIQALQDIVNPIGMLHRQADAEGAVINGSVAVQWIKDPQTYKEIAHDALKALEVKP